MSFFFVLGHICSVSGLLVVPQTEVQEVGTRAAEARCSDDVALELERLGFRTDFSPDALSLVDLWSCLHPDLQSLEYNAKFCCDNGTDKQFHPCLHPDWRPEEHLAKYCCDNGTDKRVRALTEHAHVVSVIVPPLPNWQCAMCFGAFENFESCKIRRCDGMKFHEKCYRGHGDCRSCEDNPGKFFRRKIQKGEGKYV